MISVLVQVAIMLGLSLWLPHWWWIMAVPVAWSVARKTHIWQSAWTAAVAAGLLWFGWSVWLWQWGGADLITSRVADAMRVGSSFLTLLVGALLAAIAAGFAASAGSAVRNLTTPNDQADG